jgi:8-oxo-dGTP pyrophosphatase MutT (NUDIX family)
VSTSIEDVRRALANRPPKPLPVAVSRRAAVAAVLREAGPDLELLFIRRAEDPRDRWSGQMAFPGGRSEPGDSDLVATAVRETTEEIGLDLNAQGELLGGLDEVHAIALGRPVDLSITPFVFRLQGKAHLTLSAEVTSLHWLPLDDLLGERHLSTFEFVHDGIPLRLPCLHVGDVVIWGLTFRMFSSLRDVLNHRPERMPQAVIRSGRKSSRRS